MKIGIKKVGKLVGGCGRPDLLEAYTRSHLERRIRRNGLDPAAVIPALEELAAKEKGKDDASEP